MIIKKLTGFPLSKKANPVGCPALETAEIQA
jgi:hypothetical protein